MIKFVSRLAILVTITAMTATTASFAIAASAPKIVTPDTLAWVAGTGPEQGAQVAVLEGDPTKPGPYTVRLKIPSGGKFLPHSHRDVEHVTVLSGTLLVGLGDVFDASKMKALPAGSYVVIPPGLHHFAMAQGDTVLQLHGTGPSSFDMVAAK
jgi:quercetin dioxygenase-like cupin family protein